MYSSGFHFASLLMKPDVTETAWCWQIIPGFQTSQTINNSIIFSAAASLEPICFKITLILLTRRNALLAGVCPNFRGGLRGSGAICWVSHRCPRAPAEHRPSACCLPAEMRGTGLRSHYLITTLLANGVVCARLKVWTYYCKLICALSLFFFPRFLKEESNGGPATAVILGILY